MSKLSIQDVEHIAKLSRLEFLSVEKEKFSRQLSSILEYIDLLNEINTSNVEPTVQVTGLKNGLADDKILESQISHQDIEKNAKSFEDGSFKVPGVFK